MFWQPANRMKVFYCIHVIENRKPSRLFCTGQIVLERCLHCYMRLFRTICPTHQFPNWPSIPGGSSTDCCCLHTMCRDSQLSVFISPRTIVKYLLLSAVSSIREVNHLMFVVGCHHGGCHWFCGGAGSSGLSVCLRVLAILRKLILPCYFTCSYFSITWKPRGRFSLSGLCNEATGHQSIGLCSSFWSKLMQYIRRVLTMTIAGTWPPPWS